MTGAAPDEAQTPGDVPAAGPPAPVSRSAADPQAGAQPAGDFQAAAEPAADPQAGAQPAGDFQAAADAAIGGLSAGLGPEEAALALAVLVNRAVSRLHNLGRAEAAARKGQAEWPVWAQLQNASRSLVLQASTCRTLAARLAGRAR